MTTRTPPPSGQPQALTAEREAELRADHQCSDVDTWCRAAGCKQDWPCATAQLLAALDEARSEVMRLQDNDSAYDLGYQRADAAAGAVIERLRRERAEARARAAHFESLAKDQQRLNEAMVASLKRGLEKLQASEAERDRLRQVLLDTRRNDGHWYGCWTNDGRSERCSPECALFAETLAAMDRGRQPAGEAVPPFSMHIHGSHLMPVETLDALGRMGAHVRDLYERGWRPGEPFDDAPPAPAAEARREDETDGE